MKQFFIAFTTTIFEFLVRTAVLAIVMFIGWGLIVSQLSFLPILTFPTVWLIMMMFDILRDNSNKIIEKSNLAYEQQIIINSQLNTISLMLLQIMKTNMDANSKTSLDKITEPDYNCPLDGDNNE